MKRWKEWLQDFRWQKLLIVWGVFLLIALVLFAERSGVTYSQVHFNELSGKRADHAQKGCTGG